MSMVCLQTIFPQRILALFFRIFSLHIFSKSEATKTPEKSYISSGFRMNGAKKRAVPTGRRFNPDNLSRTIFVGNETEIVVELENRSGKICSELKLENKGGGTRKEKQPKDFLFELNSLKLSSAEDISTKTLSSVLSRERFRHRIVSFWMTKLYKENDFFVQSLLSAAFILHGALTHHSATLRNQCKAP